jgi:ribosomal protein S27AE
VRVSGPTGTGEDVDMVRSDTSQKKGEHWWEFCPMCGSKLMSHKCRLVCPDPLCGYFQSSSEFDV